MNDNKQVSLYDFKGRRIRVVELDGNPWFVAADVFRVIYGTTTGHHNRMSGFPDTEVTVIRRGEGNEYPQLFFGTSSPAFRMLSESGLYKLIMRSDRPEAKEFQDWVTRDVLPAIRKDGMYVKGEEKIDPSDDAALDRMTKSVVT